MLKFFSGQLKFFSCDLVIFYRRPKFLLGDLNFLSGNLVIFYRRLNFLSSDLVIFSRQLKFFSGDRYFISGDLDLQSRLSNHRLRQDASIRALLTSRVLLLFLFTHAWRCADFASCMHAAPTTRTSGESKRYGQTMPVAHHAARHAHMRVKK